MFELNGDQYTLQDLQDFAANKNVDFDTFMSDMKGKGLTKIKPVQVVRDSKDIDSMLERQNKTEIKNKKNNRHFI